MFASFCILLPSVLGQLNRAACCQKKPSVVCFARSSFHGCRIVDTYVISSRELDLQLRWQNVRKRRHCPLCQEDCVPGLWGVQQQSCATIQHACRIERSVHPRLDYVRKCRAAEGGSRLASMPNTINRSPRGGPARALVNFFWGCSKDRPDASRKRRGPLPRDHQTP